MDTHARLLLFSSAVSLPACKARFGEVAGDDLVPAKEAVVESADGRPCSRWAAEDDEDDDSVLWSDWDGRDLV